MNKSLLRKLSVGRKLTNPRAFLDIEASDKRKSRIVLELYEDIAPITVSFFKQFCVGKKIHDFKGKTIHRVP